MKALINALLVIFAIQCAMVAGLYWPDAERAGGRDGEQLLPFDVFSLDEIHIGDEQGNEAVLLKAGDRWILPDLGGLAVNPQLIKKLLLGVIQADPAWPIAHSVAARQRFALTDYNFLRRLTLIANGELLGTLYLGSSPGFRKTHVRNSTQDAIFTVSYNSVDASGIDADWLDRGLLQIPSPASISSDSFTIEQLKNEWRTPNGQSPDTRELNALLQALATLQVRGVADEDMQRTLSIAVPALTLDIRSEQGDVRYELFTLGASHYIQASGQPLFFTLSDYSFDKFATVDAQRLRGSENYSD